MDIINFVKSEYCLERSHNQGGLESSLGSHEYIGTYNWMKDKKLTGFIEIGSAFGGSFHIWGSLIGGKKISIDIEPGHQYPWNFTLKHMEQRNSLWKSHFDDVHPIMANSQEQSTVDKVAEILDGDLVDWLFIDAEHTYAAAKSDFEMYEQFVSKDGYIAFHDARMMVADSDHSKPGIGVFWDELLATGKYNTVEFPENVVHDLARECYTPVIGIVQKK